VTEERRIAGTGSPETATRSLAVRLRGAIGFALGGDAPEDDTALAWGFLGLPFVGFALGSAVRAVVALLAGAASPLALAAVGALGLWLGGGRRQAGAALADRGRAATLFAALALLAVETALLAVLGASGSLALPLAAMLGRWAFVILAYGSTPRPGDALATRLVRAASFREFGIASVTAMAVTLLLIDAIGLLLLFAIASGTIALRIAVHARAGGVSRASLGAAAVLGEVATLACCALVASWHAAMSAGR
jgi:hypothetical protein